MYVEFTASGLREMSEALQTELKTLIPEVDEWVVNGYLSGEDDTCWSWGQDEFFEEDGITELTGSEVYQAERENEIACLQIYVKLLPLEREGKIKMCWLNDGSQYGLWPTHKAAKLEIERLKTESV